MARRRASSMVWPAVTSGTESALLSVAIGDDVPIDLPPDPNWLYSTTAQSAAAIVAIIGGFLVSRLVSLSSERSGLQRRRTELERSLARYKAEREVLDVDAYIAVRDWVLQDVLGDFIFSKVDFAKILRNGDYVGSTPTMLREITEWCWQLVTSGWELAEEDRAEFAARAKAEDVVWMEERGLPLGEGMENVARQLGEAFTKAREPIGTKLGSFVPDIRVRDQIGIRAQEERLRQRAEVGGRIAAAKVELEILDASLARVGKPEGVQEAIYVLAGFALVGIVLPLSLLALRPVPSVWWARLLVVVGFAVGLGAVVGQLLIAVRRLGRD
jgi:hypothetical protein